MFIKHTPIYSNLKLQTEAHYMLIYIYIYIYVNKMLNQNNAC